ncbi:hypothetical protein GCM10023196_017070 [Actinoallomurus vinaceus]|uniref:Uncharacterized protein n=1 Tax=Actinoallomurus vinaceus TaxID=1080074 RepID=A0ABP8U3A3_9ACTN
MDVRLVARRRFPEFRTVAGRPQARRCAVWDGNLSVGGGQVLGLRPREGVDDDHRPAEVCGESVGVGGLPRRAGRAGPHRGRAGLLPGRHHHGRFAGQGVVAGDPARRLLRVVRVRDRGRIVGIPGEGDRSRRGIELADDDGDIVTDQSHRPLGIGTDLRAGRGGPLGPLCLPGEGGSPEASEVHQEHPVTHVPQFLSVGLTDGVGSLDVSGRPIEPLKQIEHRRFMLDDVFERVVAR